MSSLKFALIWLVLSLFMLEVTSFLNSLELIPDLAAICYEVSSKTLCCNTSGLHRKFYPVVDLALDWWIHHV